ncbi:hypothetical protein Q5H92_15035 [Hymenobacter sp. M29]|uniref:Uncharacterized protein n=1 Tax=Hymenobacter mellowenesis TaxID=3063995 RepID=A0ABT9AE49_9BACT|nr:hypothetical protein [Hymenobacter sp. M29]MDO7847682.1 hypothetical protein [Hymenobacter sp. M29]
MKVGDKVKIKYRKPDNDTGLRPYSDSIGKVGVIREDECPTRPAFPYQVYGIDAETTYLGRYSEEELELLPQTQELGLEDVYTHAPQKELQTLLGQAAKKVGLNQVVASPWVFFKPEFTEPEGPGITSYGSRDGLTRNYPNKQEVSIPQFLDLLTTYSQRKKEVKVQLNAKLVATVEEGNEVVALNLNEGHGRDLYAVTQKELLDFQQALKGDGQGLRDGDYVKVGMDAGNALFQYAQKMGVKVSSNNCLNKMMSMDKYLGYNKLLATVCEPQTNLITIEEFIGKCAQQPSPLPKLAGYEVKKVKEGEVYYSDLKAPSEGLAVGCQHIPMAQFEALMEAITTK